MASIWELPIEEINAEHIERLVADKQSESINLEFKRELNLKKDSEKREAGKDVSAFANARGGLLIYGVEERALENGRKVASATVPLTEGDLVDRLTDTVHGRVDPPMRFRARLVDASAGGYYLVVKTEPSHYHLHAVDAQYYIRTDTGARPMSAAEVQSRHDQLFQLRQSGEERARAIGREEIATVPNAPWLAVVVVPLGFTGEVALETLSRDHFVAPDLPGRGLSEAYDFEPTDRAYEALLPREGGPKYLIRLRRDGALHLGNAGFCNERFFRDKVTAELCLTAARMARQVWARLAIRGPAAVFVSIRTQRELALMDHAHLPDEARAKVGGLNLPFVVSYPDGLDDGSALAAAVVNRIAQACRRPTSRLVRDGKLLPIAEWPTDF